MIANFYKLIGKDVPDSIKMPDMQDFGGGLSTFDFKDFMDNLPEGSPWTAVAVGTILVIIGARKGDTSSVASKESTEKTVAAASEALGGLTSDLVSENNILVERILGSPRHISHFKTHLCACLCLGDASNPYEGTRTNWFEASEGT